ncbi:hypothetical protein TNCV_3180901 [Trichonephila clavipes]|nr:hypothetical protein TNCV_3180901 [Trichonephila clavipes]
MIQYIDHSATAATTYASETWPLTLRDEEALGIFRLKCVDHLARMNEDRRCKKIFLGKPMGILDLEADPR